jgi:thiol:disulfide interchange protein DsbA
MKKFWLMLAFVVSSVVGSSVFAAEMSAPYETLPELLPTVKGEEGKIEVVEFLWYGCGACYNAEPTVKKWKETQPKFVNFITLPAIVGQKIWDYHARLFITLDLMGKQEQLRDDIFNEIHIKRNMLDNMDKLKELVKKHGINEEEFEKSFNSFSVNLQMNKIKDLVMKYKMFSTPSFYVAGKYKVANSQVLAQTLTQLVNDEAKLLNLSDSIITPPDANTEEGDDN